jgi:hypothetical protein
VIYRDTNAIKKTAGNFSRLSAQLFRQTSERGRLNWRDREKPTALALMNE